MMDVLLHVNPIAARYAVFMRANHRITPPARLCSNTCNPFNQTSKVFEPQSVWGASTG